MADPIIRLKRSAVAGKRPTLANLPLGEVALNTYDGRLFVRQDTGGVGIATTIRAVNPWSENYQSGGEHSIYYDGGDVGIGTQIPTSTLDVNGTVTATSFVGNGSSITGITFDQLSDVTFTNLGQHDIAVYHDGEGWLNDPGASRVVQEVRNVTGIAITQAYPVYETGYNQGNERVTIDVANAGIPTAMPALGIIHDANLGSNSNGYVIISGIADGIDTSGYSEGDELYVAVGGGLTNTRPAGATALIQKIGTVLRSHATTGSILVQGAGRTNDVPNTISVSSSITAGDGFYGDGSGITGLTHSQVSGAMGDLVDDTTPQLGGNLDLNSNDITGTGNINITGSGTFSGNVSIAGTLTYEDVTNVDSVGLITARTGIDVLSGDITLKNGSEENSIRTNSSGQFQILRDSSIVALTIDDNSGRVGIATDNPGLFALDVRGTGQVARFGDPNLSNDALWIDITNDGYPALRNPSSNDNLTLRSSGSVEISIDDNNFNTSKTFTVVSNGHSGSGTELFRINESGETTITASSTSALFIKDNSVDSSGLKLYSDSAGLSHINAGYGNLVLETSGTERFRIDSGGNVNITGVCTATSFSIDDFLIRRKTGDIQITNDAGDLLIIGAGGSTSIEIQPDPANQSITANSGGSVELFFNNVKKLETTTSGVDITGSLDISGQAIVNNSVYIADSITHIGDVDTSIRFPSNDTFTIETAGSERVRIDSAGNVGINETNPGRPLIVDGGSGSIIAAFQSTGTGCGFGLKDATTSADNVVTIRAIGNDLVSHAGGQERMRITSAGNVGINETNPAEKLTVDGTILTTNAPYSGNVDVPYLIAATSFYTGATTNWGTRGFQHRLKSSSGGVPRATIDDAQGNEAFCVQNGGNIGIGTDAPGYKLEVNGDIKVGELGTLWFSDTSGSIEKIESTASALNLYADSTISFYESDASTVKFTVNTNTAIAYFSADSDTYWYRPAANTHAWTTNGVERFRIASDGIATFNSGEVVFGGTAVSATEGGQIRLTSASGQSNGDTIIDMNSANFRIFYSNSPNKGAYLTLSSLADGVGSRILTTSDEGSGNGLDADTLDGQQGSYYLDYNNLTNVPSAIGNADTVDNLHASSFLRSDAADTATGDITFQNNKLIFDNTTFSTFDWQNYQADGGDLTWTVGGTSGPEMELESDGSNYLNAELRVGGSKVWTAGNDGTGSGLDADLLDGQEGSYYQNASNINAGTLNDARLSYTELGRSPVGNFGQWSNHSAYNNFNTPPDYWGWTYLNGTTNAPNTSSSQWYRGRFSLGNAFGLGSDAGDYWMEMAIPRYSQGGAPGNLWIRTCENGAEQSWYQVAATISGNTTWHAGNDGSGSGLDADTLDGVNSTSFLRSDANDTFTGNLANNGNNYITFGPNSTWSRYLRVGGNGYQGSSTVANIATTNGNLHLDAASGGFSTLLNYYAGTAGVGFGNGSTTFVAWMGPDGDLWKGSTDNTGSKYWHAGNDGSGSGLDADTLDGVNSGSFLRSDANDSATGLYSFAAGAYSANVTYGGRSIQTQIDINSTSMRGGVLVRNANDFRSETNTASFMHYDAYNTSATSYAFRAAKGTTLADTFWVKGDGTAYFADDVGIGINNPGAKLDVFGTARIGGTVSSGRRADFDTNGRLTLAYGDNNNVSNLILANLATDATTNHGSNIAWDFATNTSATPITAATIDVVKEQQWTSTATTQDAKFAIKLAENGVLGEKFSINSNGNVTLTGDLDLDDNKKILLGTGNDCEIYHNGGATIFQSTNGGISLQVPAGSEIQLAQGGSFEHGVKFIAGGAVQLYNNNSLKLATIAGGVDVTGDLILSGELNLMGSSDSNKFLDVRVGTNTFYIRKTTGGDAGHEVMATFTGDAGVGLYHNAVKKFETTSTGVDVTGLLSATTKSFVIDHPTKEGMKLRHGSLEGPENGVYIRGRLKENNTIELPDYWTGLVDEETITVNLTPIGRKAPLHSVVDIADNTVVVESANDIVDCFYAVFGERKDVERFEVEF